MTYCIIRQMFPPISPFMIKLASELVPGNRISTSPKVNKMSQMHDGCSILAFMELLLGPESVKSLQRGLALGLALLESSGNDGVYGHSREGGQVAEVVLLSLSAP